MNSPRLFLLTAGLCLWPAPVARADSAVEHGFLHRVYQDAEGQKAKYQVFVPYAYDGDKPFPLILFLHGSGESGSDGEKQVKVGLGPAIRKQEKTFPFVAVFPQSQRRAWQAGSADGKRAMKILDDVEKEFHIDRARVYLTGLSLGGYGTWSLAVAHPDRWAAIVPICGGGNVGQAAKIKDIPCWCFHGGNDVVVNVNNSRKMIEALREAGGHPRYTEFPGVGHNSWDKAYATADLFPWLLGHHLNHEKGVRTHFSAPSEQKPPAP